MMNQVQKS